MIRLILPFFIAVALLPATALAQGGDYYALLVGVQDYDGKVLSKLRFARGDMLEFADLLKKNGVRESNIVVMHDDVRNLKSFRHQPEADKIRRQLDLLLTGLGPNDSVIVAFSGHGVQREGEIENYFCPLGADIRELLKPAKDRTSLVSLSEIYDRLGKCRAGRKLLLVDACRDQPLTEDLIPKTAGNRKVIDLNQVAAFSRQASPAGKGIVALFSCAPGQQSFEDGGLKHGVFFHHVMKAWQKKTAGADGRLDLLELAMTARSETSAYARQLNRAQTPQLRGDITGQWLLPLSSEPAPGSTITNSLGAKLAYIPAAEFLMGSPASEKGRDDYETQHRVKLTKPFYLGVHEVTQGEWKAVMGDEPWKNKTYAKAGSSYPATYVSWDDAVKFCAALTKRERAAGRITAAQSYRLPTEAEWEYACRAGTTTRFSFGDDASYSQLKNYAWFGENAYDIGEKYAHSVGLKKPNAWGLYDMHGNVYEWCSDWSGDYPQGAVTDPQGPNAGSYRVYRGGSWFSFPQGARSANRNRLTPGYRRFSMGFRVALSPAGSGK